MSVEYRVDCHLDIANIYDYSFLNISSTEGIINVEPVNAQEIEKRNREEGSIQKKDVGIRLCYNQIPELSLQWSSILDKVTHNALQNVRWIDLSCNQLSSVEPLTSMENLLVLYLHGNKFKSPREVRALQSLPKLKKLTLYANPIADMKGYRLFVLAILPNLKMVDFGIATKRELNLARMWAEINRGVVNG